jgi:hypothetical protein
MAHLQYRQPHAGRRHDRVQGADADTAGDVQATFADVDALQLIVPQANGVDQKMLLA